MGDDLISNFSSHAAYCSGPNGHPLFSTYGSGGTQSSDWESWKSKWNDNVYLIPDFDDTDGYNTSDPGWWSYWGDVVDGTFSWETAWPAEGVTDADGDVNEDQVIVNGSIAHGKTYMMRKFDPQFPGHQC